MWRGQERLRHDRIEPMKFRCTFTFLAVAAVAFAQGVQTINPSPDRKAGEGEGPFDRMVIRGITMIDGTGAPARGPVDIVVHNNRIAEIRSVGAPGVAISDRGRPAKGTKELD